MNHAYFTSTYLSCHFILGLSLVSNIELQLDEGVESLDIKLDRLDSRVTIVGQTAANIGDNLEVATPLLFLTFHTRSGGLCIIIAHRMYKYKPMLLE